VTEYIEFDMCVNDDQGYGQHTGKLRAAQFSTRDSNELDIHIECVGREMTCRKLDGNHIRVGRRIFPVVGYQSYVGNMMWDSALVTVETANAIVDALRTSGNYAPDNGAANLWDRREAESPLFLSARVADVDG
jgi:hypothetical protein